VSNFGGLVAKLSKPETPLQIRLGHFDGANGLKPIGDFYLYQALLVMFPMALAWHLVLCNPTLFCILLRVVLQVWRRRMHSGAFPSAFTGRWSWGSPTWRLSGRYCVFVVESVFAHDELVKTRLPIIQKQMLELNKSCRMKV